MLQIPFCYLWNIARFYGMVPGVVQNCVRSTHHSSWPQSVDNSGVKQRVALYVTHTIPRSFSCYRHFCEESPPVASNSRHKGPVSRMSAIWNAVIHGDVIKWKHFPRYWPFVRGIHRSPVNSPHKGHWRGALMFFVCVWINGWVNFRETGHCNVANQYVLRSHLQQSNCHKKHNIAVNNWVADALNRWLLGHLWAQ